MIVQMAAVWRWRANGVIAPRQAPVAYRRREANPVVLHQQAARKALLEQSALRQMRLYRCATNPAIHPRYWYVR